MDPDALRHFCAPETLKRVGAVLGKDRVADTGSVLERVWRDSGVAVVFGPRATPITLGADGAAVDVVVVSTNTVPNVFERAASVLPKLPDGSAPPYACVTLQPYSLKPDAWGKLPEGATADAAWRHQRMPEPPLRVCIVLLGAALAQFPARRLVIATDWEAAHALRMLAFYASLPPRNPASAVTVAGAWANLGRVLAANAPRANASGRARPANAHYHAYPAEWLQPNQPLLWAPLPLCAPGDAVSLVRIHTDAPVSRDPPLAAARAATLVTLGHMLAPRPRGARCPHAGLLDAGSFALVPPVETLAGCVFASERPPPGHRAGAELWVDCNSDRRAAPPGGLAPPLGYLTLAGPGRTPDALGAVKWLDMRLAQMTVPRARFFAHTQWDRGFCAFRTALRHYTEPHRAYVPVHGGEDADAAAAVAAHHTGSAKTGVHLVCLVEKGLYRPIVGYSSSAFAEHALCTLRGVLSSADGFSFAVATNSFSREEPRFGSLHSLGAIFAGTGEPPPKRPCVES